MRPSIDSGGHETGAHARIRRLEDRCQRYEELLMDWLRAGNEILCSASHEIDYDYLAEIVARTRPIIHASGSVSGQPDHPRVVRGWARHCVHGVPLAVPCRVCCEQVGIDTHTGVGAAHSPVPTVAPTPATLSPMQGTGEARPDVPATHERIAEHRGGARPCVGTHHQAPAGDTSEEERGGLATTSAGAVTEEPHESD